MLILKNLEGVKYNLSTKSEHSVGRHGSDIEIRNDDSISRKHASVRILVKGGKLHVELRDTGSKHGTFVNDGINKSEAISKETMISLNVKDKVRFGQRLGVWTLEEEPFLICAPSLTPQDETTMKKLFTKVKGSIVSELSKSCSHLSVNEITMETKVICALAYSKPIVTFEYWKQLLTALTSRKEQPIPDYTDFIPVATDSLRRMSNLNFSVNPSRRTLFRNHIFVVFDKEQCAKVSSLVEAAGGKIFDATVKKISLQQLTSKNVIVVQAKDERINKTMETCLDLLKKQKKRAVSETEICLSIIHASKDRYCNPFYDAKTLFNFESSVASNDDTILVEDSQDITEANTEIQEPGSGSNFSLAINDQNRALSDTDDDFVVPDSPPLVEDHSTTRSGLKRKLEDPSGRPSVKNSKLDSFVTRGRSNDNADSSNSPGIISSATKEDSSSISNTVRTSGRSSRSLFAGVKDRVIPNSGALFEKSSGESSCSLVSDSLKRPADEITSEIPSRRSRSLFAKSNTESSETASVTLFSDRVEESPILGKRKAPEPEVVPAMSSKRKLPDQETNSPSKKKPNKSFSLFEAPQSTKRSRKIAYDFHDEMDSPINSDPSKLTISRSPAKRSVSLPVVHVPTTVDLRDFIQSHDRNNEIKRDPEVDISSEIKDMLDKTVLHSVSLIKEKENIAVPESTHESKRNFKKFRKNSAPKPSSIIPITSLVLFKPSVKDEM